MGKQFQTIETIPEVIQTLGGPEAVRRLTKRNGKFTVPMWVNRDRFPAVTYTTIQNALNERGYVAPGRLWGMP